jgi:hypothetical protein
MLANKPDHPWPLQLHPQPRLQLHPTVPGVHLKSGREGKAVSVSLAKTERFWNSNAGRVWGDAFSRPWWVKLTLPFRKPNKIQPGLKTLSSVTRTSCLPWCVIRGRIPCRVLLYSEKLGIPHSATLEWVCSSIIYGGLAKCNDVPWRRTFMTHFWWHDNAPGENSGFRIIHTT